MNRDFQFGYLQHHANDGVHTLWRYDLHPANGNRLLMRKDTLNGDGHPSSLGSDLLDDDFNRVDALIVDPFSSSTGGQPDSIPVVCFRLGWPRSFNTRLHSRNATQLFYHLAQLLNGDIDFLIQRLPKNHSEIFEP